MSHREIFNSITEKLKAQKPPVIVTIDGPAGAGKTTLATEISNSFEGTVIIHMDDLYRGWLLTLGPTLTRELESILIQLKDSGGAQYFKYDWQTGQLGGETFFQEPRVLIFEGVGASQKFMDGHADIKIWIEVDSALGLKRVRARDGEGISDEMENFILEQEMYFALEEPKKRSDFFLSTN